MNRLKELPAGGRPYEKAETAGFAALTDAELLAILLRTGTKDMDVLTLAARLLDIGGRNEGLAGLMRCSVEEFRELDGIGRVKAIQLSALGELVKRIWRRGVTGDMPAFRTPEDCAHYYMQDMRHLEQEELRAAYLDTRLRLISEALLTKGTVNSSPVSVREIMIGALRRRAVSMLLVHNHPSGDPSPSDQDIQVTEQVKSAGELVGIPLFDHIIIGDNTYYSFREWGSL